jgi:hypothetical protein
MGKISTRTLLAGILLCVTGALISGCSDSSIGVPGGTDLNSKEEQKKVEDHYNDLQRTGASPSPAGEPGGKL